MSSTYDPTNDTVSTITVGLLPLLIVGLYKGFEDDKKKPFSLINIFDDFIIFTSIIILPFILGIQWFQYFSDDNKTKFILQCTIPIIGGLFSYIVYIIYHYNSREKLWSQLFVIIVSNFFIFLPFFGHIMLISGDKNKDYISDYCKEYFTYYNCKVLRSSNYMVYVTSFIVNFLGVLIKLCIHFLPSFEWSKSDKFGKFNKCLRTFGIFCNHVVIISIIIYPAIISGWLLSNNPVTTKIAFGICSISLTRLIDHFDDNKLERTNTMISLYLNQYKKKNKPMVDIRELAKEIGEKTKKMGKGINEIRGQIKEIYMKWTSKLSPIEEKLVLKMFEVERQTEEIEKELKNIGERIGGIYEEANEIGKKISGIKEMKERLEKNEVRLTINQNN